MPLAAAERRVKGLPVLFPDSDAYTAVNNRLETIAAYYAPAWLWLRVYYRVRLSRDDIIALVPSGVFDSISGGKTRALQTRTLSRLCANSGHTRYSEGSLDEERPWHVFSHF